MAYKACESTPRKAEHYDSIQHANIYSEFECVGGYDTKQIAFECFFLYSSAVLKKLCQRAHLQSAVVYHTAAV